MNDSVWDKKQEYFRYIQNHRINVINVLNALHHMRNDHIETMLISDNIWNTIYNRIEEHDDSKFLQAEFEGYRQFFYPTDYETKDKTQFDYAWNHHQKHNPHHWEYWVIFKVGESVALEIPIEHVIEMLCDWTAMSVVFKNKPSDWYEKEKSKILMHDNTVDTVEKLIPIFDHVYQKLIDTIAPLETNGGAM